MFHCVTCRPSAGRIAAPGLGERLRPVETLASGVAHRAASFASCAPWSTCRGECVRSCAVAVGQSLTASVRLVPACITPVVVECRPDEAASVVAAVGQHEEPLAQVRRPDLGRAEQTPLRIEPERGKVAKHVGEPKVNVPWDVLEEGERSAALVEDASHFGPQVALIGVAESLTGDAEWLARVARSDEIHDATPRSAVEGSEIVGDRSAIQLRRFHPGHEDGRGEGLALDVAHGAAVGGQSDTELEPTDASA